jgi:hypothetical protein
MGALLPLNPIRCEAKIWPREANYDADLLKPPSVA